MEKRHFAFTAARLRDINLPDVGRVFYYDAALRGLALEVSDTGAKSFRVYRKFRGRPVKITLGPFGPMLPETRDLPEGAEPLDLLGNHPALNVRMARKMAMAVLAEKEVVKALRYLDSPSARRAMLAHNALQCIVGLRAMSAANEREARIARLGYNAGRYGTEALYCAVIERDRKRNNPVKRLKPRDIWERLVARAEVGMHPDLQSHKSHALDDAAAEKLGISERQIRQAKTFAKKNHLSVVVACRACGRLLRPQPKCRHCHVDLNAADLALLTNEGLLLSRRMLPA